MPYFIYSRKSQEDDSRQVQSIDDQLKSSIRLADATGLMVADTFIESMSAKRPGRPVFERMLARIEAGEADGIIAWHPDRLARNAVDSGRIIDLLDRGRLSDLKFDSFRFENTPEGKWMLGIVLGQSKYFVDKLSTDVKRGIRSKLEKGAFPHKAPPGYKNDLETHTIVADPERFDLLRRAVERLLTGAYSVPQVLDMLNVQWGFRTRRTAKTGGGALSRSAFYKLLSSRFYTGVMEHAGEVWPGKHPAMMSVHEYEALQRIVKRASKELGEMDCLRSCTRQFAYTGLIRCGRCGYQVTAQRKTKWSERRGETREYLYYHCSNWNGKCNKQGITEEAVTSKIGDLLHRLMNCDEQGEWEDWSAPIVQRAFARGETAEAASIAALRQALSAAESKKARLLDDRYGAPGVLTDGEFLAIKAKLQAEINACRIELQKAEAEAERIRDVVRNVFEFSRTAPGWFDTSAEPEIRKQIARRLATSYVLTAGVLQIEINPLLVPLLTFEPGETGSRSNKKGCASRHSPVWLDIRDEVQKIASERPELAFSKLISNCP